jgi:hypothetical protein
MITITNVNKFNNTINICGLSIDVKPTENFEFENVNYKIRNGSTFYEMDVKKAYIYDEENHVWCDV